MKIFKFGGASINSEDRIRNTGNIIKSYSGEKILIVVSAMGKTTNTLEEVVHSFINNEKSVALSKFENIKQSHLQTLTNLVGAQAEDATSYLESFFTEIEWLLHDNPVRGNDYYYDQIVCSGELMSSRIVAQYLQNESINACWIDVRDIIRTDDTFRDATIDWRFTEKRIYESVIPLFDIHDVIVTQGFIGSTDQNESTTLGREGSDYSAAIFANIINAESVTIWKDVDAVMSADPKKYANASIIKELSYTEVIEMAYYGAQVIHPKTIKPLQNKNIPLLVKSFIDPSLPGTIISNNTSKQLPPIIVNKENQVLITFQTKDFSFVEDKPAEQLQELFRAVKVKPNLSQRTAISLLCCFDDHPEKIQQLALQAGGLFDVHVEKALTLLTIRHFQENILESLINGRTVILEQKTTETVQMLMRD